MRKIKKGYRRRRSRKGRKRKKYKKDGMVEEGEGRRGSGKE
jgi:hypothetical protein